MPAEWKEVLAKTSAAAGHVLIVGPVDCGKTTFTTLLAARRTSLNGSVVIIDADLGQSEIGPPACISAGIFDHGMSTMSQASVLYSSFVGAVSPAAVTASMVKALLQVLNAVSGPRCILDTGGYALRSEAWQQIMCLAAAIRPTDIVLLQRANEAAPLERMLRLLPNVAVHAPLLPNNLQVKSREYRSQRRRMRFSAALNPSSLLEFDFAATPLVPTWLGTGNAVPSHLYAYIKQALAPSIRLYHAEYWGNQLGLLVSAEPLAKSPALQSIRSATKTTEVHCILAPMLKNKLVGLVSHNQSLLALGILEKLDCKRGVLGIRTTLRTTQSVGAIHLGHISLHADGSEIK